MRRVARPDRGLADGTLGRKTGQPIRGVERDEAGLEDINAFFADETDKKTQSTDRRTARPDVSLANGQRGRKTGKAIRGVERDRSGLENVDAFFSSPQSSRAARKAQQLPGQHDDFDFDMMGPVHEPARSLTPEANDLLARQSSASRVFGSPARAPSFDLLNDLTSDQNDAPVQEPARSLTPPVKTTAKAKSKRRRSFQVDDEGKSSLPSPLTLQAHESQPAPRSSRSTTGATNDASTSDAARPSV